MSMTDGDQRVTTFEPLTASALHGRQVRLIPLPRTPGGRPRSAVSDLHDTIDTLAAMIGPTSERTRVHVAVRRGDATWSWTLMTGPHGCQVGAWPTHHPDLGILIGENAWWGIVQGRLTPSGALGLGVLSVTGDTGRAMEILRHIRPAAQAAAERVSRDRLTAVRLAASGDERAGVTPSASAELNGVRARLAPAQPPTPEGIVPRAPEPTSALFRHFGDARSIMFGPHALLLQVMHPVVGAGVLEHSNFKQEAWRRLFGTGVSMSTVVYGGPEGTAAECRRLREMHKPIKGVDQDGNRYSARDPEAWAWVYATLLRGSIDAQTTFGRPLRPEVLEEYYRQGRELGMVLGVRKQDLPEDWDGFLTWFDHMVETRLRPTEPARDVLTYFEHVPKPAPLRLLPTPLWALLIWPVAFLARLVTAGTLPPVVRDRLGLEWTPGRQRLLNLFAFFVRLVFLLIPPPLRCAPAFLMARGNVRLSRRRERRRQRQEAQQATPGASAEARSRNRVT